LPTLGASLSSFAQGHRKQYPELERVLDLFENLSDVLIIQNRNEEEIIFPYIREIENTYLKKETDVGLFVHTLRKHLINLEKEPTEIGELLSEMRFITYSYKVPSDCCTNHRVLFNKLRELDNDLVQHRHLEKNILFPKAILMEKDLLRL
jgi:regulator of cell morphogenesis and NO signaling